MQSDRKLFVEALVYIIHNTNKTKINAFAVIILQNIISSCKLEHPIRKYIYD